MISNLTFNKVPSTNNIVMATKKITMKGRLLAACFFAVAFSGMASAHGSRTAQAAKEYENTLNAALGTVTFMENKGQWPSHVLYRADVPGAQMLATPQGMLVGQFDPKSLAERGEYMHREEQYQRGEITLEQLGKEPVLKGHGWRFNFLNGNLANAATIERKGESQDYYNFLIGDASKHATNVRSYSELVYKNVYQGIDVRYYTTADGDFENDIIVAPGADYSKLLLQIEGVELLSINRKGEAVFQTTVGEQTIPAPVSYLLDKNGRKTPIAVKFEKREGNVIAFNIPKYDVTQTLVIDPIVMRWATLVSGNSSANAHFHGIDLDAAGNIYATGRYSDNMVTVGAFQTTASGGTSDIFISKYTEPATPGGSGTRVWQTYMGDSGTDNPYALTVGLDGYVYIVGSNGGNLAKTYGTGFTAGSWTQRTGNGTTFIAKVHPDGTGAAVRTLGSGTATSWSLNLFDVRVYPTTGNNFDLICVGTVTQQGSSSSGDIPQATQPSGTNVTGTGHTNGYAIRITNNLATITWNKQFSSSGTLNENFNICAIDTLGNIVVGGVTAGTTGISFSNPSTQTTLVGSSNGWLMRLNPANGNAVWSRYFNSTSGNSCNILCMETNKNKTQIIIGGRALGNLATANITSGAFQTTHGGGTADFYVASIPYTGASTTWGTYYGGNGNESNMMGLNLDQNNDVYVLGYTTSKNITAFDNPLQSSTYDNTNSDAIFFKLNSTGTSRLYATYLGGTEDETDPIGQRGIKFADCRIYLPITTYSNNFPLTQGTLTSTKSSATSIGEPVLVSMANPPDLQGNQITGGANQTITCGSSPAPITAPVPSYILANIIRNNSLQTNGTSGAYPSGVPVITSYQWQRSYDSGQTWVNIAGATAQNYTPPAITINGVTMFRRIINGDACNRASDTLAVVTIVVTPSVDVTAGSNVSGCVNTGTNVQLTASSTTPGATFTWTGPNGFTSNQQNPLLSNVTPANSGTYTVFATAPNGCTSPTATVSITVGQVPIICLTKVDLPCNNICTGEISLILCNDPALTNYTALWSTGSTSTTGLTGLCIGNYSVTVTDANGCSATGTIPIQTQTDLTSAINVTEPDVNQSNGALDLAVLGGTAPFTYLWSTGATTQDLTNVGAGIYCVTITDATGKVITDKAEIVAAGFSTMGSIIVNMGVLPQTFGNGLKPYGLVYDLVRNYNVPIKWIIAPGKSIDPFTSTFGVDFVHNNRTYRGSAFVIDQDYLTPAVRTRLTFWQGQGVDLDTMVSNQLLPVYQIITSFPNTVIDQQNEQLVIPYYTNAGVATSTYRVGLPANLTGCDDVYALPHADPTWANHGYLRTFNMAPIKGYIWSGCHAVSALEGIFQTSPVNTSIRMNFLSTSGLQCYNNNGCGSLITETHTSDGNTPFTYDQTLGSEPVMQFMGDMTPSQNNGSERMYIPLTTSAWRATTRTAIRTNDSTGVGITKKGVKMAYGPGYGDINNGMVMYQAGHTSDGNGTTASQVAFQRAYFNFLLMTGVQKKLNITANVPAGFYAGVTDTLIISVSGGATPYTYQWTSTCGAIFGSATSATTTFTLPANTPVNTKCIIQCRVTDNCGRTNLYSKVITTIPVIDPVRYIISNLNATSCFGQCNGSITGTAGGGTGPYTYNWSTGATTSSISGLCAGVYVVTITDNVGCQKIDSIPVTEPADLVATFAVTKPLCSPVANGSIITTVTGGTPAYSFSWAGGATTQNRINIASGTYSVTITDSKGCNKNYSIVVTDSTTFTPTAGSSQPTYCQGETIQLTSSGGGTYNWSGPASFGSTSQNPTRANALPSYTGTYTVTVTNPSGCTGTASVNVSVTATPPAPTNVSISPNPVCTGNDVTLTATGSNIQWTGPPSNTYSASGSPVTRSITNTNQGGTYSVTQTVNGCVSTPATVNLVVNPTPVIGSTSSSNPTTCGGTNGSITLNGLNPSTTYAVTYNKDGNPVGPVNILSSVGGSVVITGLTAGSYTNIIVTLTGCPSAPVVGPIVLIDPSTPLAPSNVNASPNPICSGNTLTLTATGSNLQWSYPDGGGATGSPVTRTNVTVAMTGTYSVTQTVAGCTSPPATVNVVVNQTPSITSTSSSNPTTCFGTNGSITLGGLVAGSTYSVTYDKGGVGQGPFNIVANGSGQVIIAGLTAGSYTNFIVTINGCPSAPVAGPINLVDPSNPPAPTNVIANPNPICINNTLTLSATGSNLSWTGPSSYSATGSPVTRLITTTLHGGTYQVTQTVANCVSPPASVVVVVKPTPAITSTNSSNPTTCGGSDGSITLIGLSADSTYSVTYDKNGFGQGPFNIVANASGHVIIAGLTAGVYSNFVVTLSGCPSNPVIGNITLTDPSNPPAPSNVTASPNPICTGNTVTFSATGSNLQWIGPMSYSATGSPVTRSITDVNQGGTYSVTQTVANCVSPPATVNLVVNPTPVITSTSSINPTTCGGTEGTITLNGLDASTSYTVTYTKGITPVGPVLISTNGSGQLIITGLTAGTYSNIVVSLTGCPSAAAGPITLTDPANPAPPVATNSGPACYGDTLKLFATNVINGTYTWSGPGGYSSNQQNPIRVNATPAMSGVYSVVVTVANCNSTPATTTVTVTSCPPVAVNDNYSTNEDQPLPISDPGVLTNDYDPANPQQPLTVNTTPISNPSNGSVSLNANGSFTYTPALNFNGIDSFQYSICDTEVPAACDTATVYITVIPVNDPPFVPDTTITTPEDTPITVCIPIMDPESTTQSHLIQAIYCGPNNGVLSNAIVNNGSLPHTACITYTPNDDFNGVDSVCLVICDNGVPQLCDTSKITIIVTPVNDPPVAMDDYYVSCLDTAIKKNVMSNDSDVDGPALGVASVVWGPFTGSVSLIANGDLTYTPVPFFNSLDSFSYVICDNGIPNLCDTAVVVLDYTCTNTPPVAVNDNYTIPEDQTLNNNVSTNDYDPNGDSLIYNTTPLVDVSHGSLTLNNDGTFTYVPNPNYFGPDSFVYSVCDNGVPPLCDTATAYITVTPVNDKPFVPDTTVTTPEDTAITVCVPITDIDVADNHVAILGCQPANGAVSSLAVNNTGTPHIVCVTYTPNTNFNGTDSFCVIVCDNGIPTLCDTSVITVIVTPVNDPPVAVNDFYTTNEDTPLSIGVGTGVRANDNDNADGNPVSSLTIDTIPLSGPSHGTLTLTATGSFIYIPDTNFFGIDSFQYIVCDNGTPLPSLCDTGTAYITILSVNDPPFVPDTTVTTPEDTPITVCIPIIDPETTSQIHLAFVCDNPDNGTISTPNVNLASNPHIVCVTYTPNTNFNGTDSFCIIVCDNGNPILCDTSIVTIIVTPVNDPPVANNDFYSTNEDTPLNIGAPGVQSNDYDPDGTTLTSTIVTGTSNGSVVLNPNGSFTYTPNANFNGTDTFVYAICDAGIPLPSLCDTAIVVITVNPVNDPPFVPDTTVTTPEDTPITVCIPITDGDVGQQYIATICGTPANGLITFGPIVNNGAVPPTVCVTYTPNSNFNGIDSLCITVCDNGIPFLCDNSIIKIIVTPVNDPPVAVDDNYTTPEDEPLNVPGPGVLGNDNDPDGTTLTATIVSTTTNGSLTLNPNGSFTYIPNPNFNGTDTFVYSACDAGIPLPSLCDTAVVIITVTPVNDPPEIPDTTVTTCEDCPIDVCIPFTDNDSLDLHFFTSLCPGVNGSVTGTTINQALNTLCFTYTPYLNVTGSDTVCFIVCDNGNPTLCDTTTITILITPVNDPPYADTIYVVTYENQPVGVNVASATGDPEGNPLSYSYYGVIPGGGTYGITGNGAIVVYPNPGFTGTFTIPYSVCDLSPYPINVLCDSAAIIVTVLPAGDTLINHAPVASNDYVTTYLNTPVVVNQLANDYDPDGDALQVTVTCPPAHGNYTVNPNGTVNYFPNNGFFGYDTICYTICDPTAANNPKPLCDNAIIVIYVSKDSTAKENDPPVAVDDFAFICADANATLNVLHNDYDPNGNAITSVQIIDNVDHGILVSAGFGFYVYIPNGTTALNDTFQYQICDNGTPSLCDTGMAVIFINATPTITPSSPSLSVCSGDSVHLTFTSNVPGTVITWTATNGTSGTGDIHTVLTNNTTFNQTVVYTVSGYTGAGCGSAALTIPVTIRPRPAISYVANGNIFCSGEQVVINASSSIAGTTYTWSGTNGSNGTGSLVTDNPVNNGTTNITVTYSIVPTHNGCEGDTLKVDVVVKPRPVLSVDPATQTVCSGTPITIDISSNISGTSINWFGSNSNSGNSFTINDSPFNFGNSNITITYTVNGTYNGCPATTVFATVVVRPRVVADAGLDKSVVACSGSCATLGSSPTGAGGSGTLTYTWSPSTGLNDSTLANPTACGLFTSTTYTVVVTDGSGCSATDQVTVNSTPNPLSAEAGSGGALCLGSGDSVMLGGYPTAVGGVAPYTYTWSPLTGLNLTNTANPDAFPTTTTQYFVTVTDQIGCQSVDSTVVTVYPTLFADAGVDTTVCAGQPVRLGGSPTAVAGSGNGFSYTWAPTVGVSNINSPNPIATAFTTTSYTVTVTDGNGCSAIDNILVTINPLPTALAGADKSVSVCPGDSIFIGDVPAATGGTPGYTYTWNPSVGLSDSSIANPWVRGLTSTKVYTLQVTDANGCTATDNVIVTVTPSTLAANAGGNKQVCAGACVQLGGFPTEVGGFPPHTFHWSNGSTLSDSLLNIPVACPTVTTTYTVTVTDDKGCTATSSAVVTVNPVPVVDAGADTAICAGTSVQIGGSPTASSGSAPYAYSWSPTVGLSLPNIPNPVASPIVITTYQLTVTDNKGCSATDIVTVNVRSNPVVNAGADKSLVACVADTTFIGGIPAVVSGGTAPYTYQWSPATGLSSTTVQNPLVTGITATTSYQLLVTDTFGCQGADFVIVNLLPSTLQAEAGNAGVVCAAANTPVQLGGNPTAAGGTAPYSYAWSNGALLSDSTAPNPIATVSSTTTFYVTVTDSKGCVAIDSVTVTQNVSPIADAGADTTLCSGFGVVLGGSPTATSGTGPYQYSWTPTLGLNANNVANPLAVPLVTTVYTVLVTDANGCQITDNVVVTINPNPTADAGPDKTIVACPFDTIQIGGSPTASGGAGNYTYAWSPNTGVSDTSVSNPFVTGISASQLYAVTVTDANGCSAVDAVVVAVVSSSLTAEAGNGGTICAGAGSQVQLGGFPTAVGGTPSYTYSWSNGLSPTANPEVAPTVTTTYYLTVTDSKGCEAYDSVTVFVNEAPVACAGNDTAVCYGVKIRLGCVPAATGGTAPYTYLWSNGSTASNPLVGVNVTTIFTLTVTDANGCTGTSSVVVEVNPLPVADAGPDKTLTACSQDSVQLGGSPTASGGTAPYVYSWSPSTGLTDDSIANPYVKNLGSTTTFVLVVTDQNNCSAADQVLVNVTNPTLFAEAGNNVAFCAGSAVNVTLGGMPTAVGGALPYSYSWSPATGLSSTTVANPIATPSQTTTYTVVVTDANGCVAQDTVKITINPRPDVSAGANDTICAGACVTLGGSPTASGGTGATYTYNWGPAFFFNTATNIANPVVCPTGNITYAVTVTDSIGCTSTASVFVKVNQNPVANAGNDQSTVFCANACVTLGGSPTATSGTAPYFYAWSPSTSLNNTGLPNPTACNVSGTTTYTLTVTDANGCTATDQVLVNSSASNLTADAGVDKSICAGGVTCITIGGNPTVSGGTGPFSITWSPVAGICNSNTITNPDVNPTDTTTYVVLVQDANGCIAVDSMVVFANPAVTASVGEDTAICDGGAALLGGNPTGSGGTPPYSYSWSPSNGLSSVNSPNPTASPATITPYCVTVTDAVGCTATTCQRVSVNPSVTANAGPDHTMTACVGSFAQLGGSPTGVGGTGNFSYAWSPVTVDNIQVLSAGTVPNPFVTNLSTTTTFTITVTDNVTGCSATDQVTVFVNQTTLTVDAGADKVYCANSSTGVTIGGNPTAIGGSAPYIYQWAPIAGLNNPTIANPVAMPLNTTTYYVTVTDNLGCNKVDSVTVVVGPQIAVNAGNDTAICYNTNVVLGGNPAAVGGTGSFTYAWTPSQFLNSTTIAHPTAQNVLFNTTYTLTVTDSLGCSASGIVVINTRPLPVANAGPDVSIFACSGDSAILGGSPTASGTVGPYTYSWFPPLNVSLSSITAPNPVVSNLGFTTQFIVTVTDVFGCQANDNVTVTVLPNTVIAEAGINIGTLCSNTGGCVMLGGIPAATGGTPGYTFQWIGGIVNDQTAANPQACPQTTTTYTLIVTDSKGCQATDSVQVIVNDPTEASIAGLNSHYCVNTQSVTMTGIPAGGVFTGPGVTGNVFQPSQVGIGTWCVKYTYTNPTTGCVDDTTICVTVDSLPVVSVSGFSSTYCRYDAPVTIIGNPAGGTFTGPGMSGSQFNPATANVGANVITYTYSDGNGCFASTQFTITVQAAPTLSIAANDDSACANQTVVISPTYSLNVTNIQWAQLGGGVFASGLNPVSIVPTGVDYCVVATAVAGNTGCIARDTICVHVNQNPFITDPQVANTCEEEPVTINTSQTVSDPEGDANVYAIVSTLHGTSTVNSAGVITYTPNLNFNGVDTITYTACNAQCLNQCATGIVVVNVCAVNDTPVVANVSGAICRDSTITFCPQAIDVDGDPVTIAAFACGTLNGTINNTGNNCFTFTPNVGWTGTQQFCFTACDTAGACDTATATVTVNPCNFPPVANNDAQCTDYLAAATINVTANDTDPDGNPLTVTAILCNPVRGTAVISGNNIVYTPGAGANATNGDTLCYVVCDNGQPALCDTAFVYICINNSVVGVNDTILTGQFHPVNIPVKDNDFDPEGDPFTVISVITTNTVGSATLNINGTVNYVPNIDTCGFIDSFQYVVQDIHGALDTATVYVIIDCCPRPEANQDNVLVVPGNVITINPTVNDQANGLPITVEIVSGPYHGTAVLDTGNKITYTHSFTYCGFDTIYYSIESHCGIDTSLIVVNVNCNIPPTANTDTVTVCVNNTINFNPLLNDVDSNGNQMIITGINPPFGVGAFSLNSNVVTFVSTGVKGTFTMQYYVCDNGIPSFCDTGYVILKVIDCQQLVDTILDTTFINTPVTVCIGEFVNTFIPVFITNICDPDNGTVVYNEGDTCFTYIPDEGFYGNDVFCIVLCDSVGNNCINGTVIITVLDTLIQAVDEPCDLDTTIINTPITVDVLANDILPWGADTTVTIITQQIKNGTAVVNSNNTITVTPATDSTGTITFSYEVCVTTGSFSFCDTANVCITVIDTTKWCFLPNGFSPNGDGVNDTYVIPCNDDYPEAKFRVYNRWGVEVWRSNGHYLNDWDGTNMQGTKCPDGTYYGIYEYNDGKTKDAVQFIVIHR